MLGGAGQLGTQACSSTAGTRATSGKPAVKVPRVGKAAAGGSSGGVQVQLPVHIPGRRQLESIVGGSSDSVSHYSLNREQYRGSAPGPNREAEKDRLACLVRR